MSEAVLPPSRPQYASDREVSFGIKFSLIAHLALFSAVMIKATIFPSKPVLYIPSLRVDLVGLPDQLKNETVVPSQTVTEALKKAEQEAKKIENKVKPLPKQEKAAPDEMVLKPKKATEDAPPDKKVEKKNKSALERMKALEKIASEVKSANSAVIKGNKVSKGSSLSGDARESSVAHYYDLVQSRLQENWALPVYLQRQNFRAEILIKIDSRGRLRSFVFMKASGNAAFDREVERTLQESQPFPPPSDDVASAVLVDGIPVHFPL